MYSFLLLTKQTNKKKDDIFKIYHQEQIINLIVRLIINLSTNNKNYINKFTII